MPATFDGDNLIITLPGTGGAGALTVDAEIDLYSDWKEWFKTPGNAKYPQAFRTTGGDGLTPGIAAGAYFFLRNDLGWRIRPAEEDATWSIVGNLVPQDATLPVVVPTIGAFTALVVGLQPVTQNVDSILESQINSVTNLQYLIESERRNHNAHAGVLYWDPANGSDSASGDHPDRAFKTFAAAHGAANVGDVIFALSTAAGNTVVNETITLSKERVGLRGPGHSFRLMPMSQTGATVTITGDHCAIENVMIMTAGGAYDGLLAQNCDHTLIRNCMITQCQRGIVIDGCTSAEIISAHVMDPGSHGMELINGADEALISGPHEHATHIEHATGDGIRITSADDVHIHDTVVYHTGGTGINFQAGASHGFVGPEVIVTASGVADYADSGSENYIGYLNPLTASDEIIQAILNNKTVTDPVAGTMTVYDVDDVTPKYVTPIYEDVAGTVPYSGENAVNRRDRLA